ncbi:hypothetical protein [Mucilaginibacter flavidus]|nr:hypothetical protein [Mucilaginibacter flavidus]
MKTVPILIDFSENAIHAAKSAMAVVENCTLIFYFSIPTMIILFCLRM